MPVRRLDEYLRRFSDRVARADVELEAAIRRLAEALADEIAARLGRGCEAGGEEVARAVERALEPLRREVAELRRSIEELAESIKALQRAPTASRARQQDRRLPRWLSALLKELEEDGFRLASQLPREIVDSYDSRLAEAHGVYSLGLEGDVVFVKRDALEALVEALSAIKVGDEAEVAAKLDGRLRRLFEVLRRNGYLVFSSQGWTPVGELKRIVKGG